jgi:hypothetical protein
MKCPEAVMLGVAGGAIVQLIALWGSMTTWQKARHDLLMDGIRPLPSLTSYIDPLADTLNVFHPGKTSLSQLDHCAACRC